MEWLELLGTLNEALVKMALNVSDHRKTPVLHSTVGCLSVQEPSPHEQPWLSYCKITPPSPFSCSCFPGSLTAVALAGFTYYTCLIAPKYSKHAIHGPFSPRSLLSSKDSMWRTPPNMCTCLLTLVAEPTVSGLTRHSIIPVYIFQPGVEDLNLDPL